MNIVPKKPSPTHEHTTSVYVCTSDLKEDKVIKAQPIFDTRTPRSQIQHQKMEGLNLWSFDLAFKLR